MGPQLLSVSAVWSLERRISVHCKWATTVPSGGVGFFMVPWHPLLAPLPVTTEVPTCACEQWSCVDRSVCFLGTQDLPTSFPRSIVKYSSIQDRTLGLGLRIRAHTKDKKVLSSFLALLLDGDASTASIVRLSLGACSFETLEPHKASSKWAVYCCVGVHYQITMN